MKILKLQAENIKRLKAVEITPDPEGHAVIIAGRNAQGKSSVLESIWLALGGGSAARDSDIARPVRDGEEKGVVMLDLGELIVTKTFTAEGKSSLKVTSADGVTVRSPQGILDSLIGKIGFDPMLFSRMDPAKQKAELLGLVNLGIDLDDLAAKRQEIYDARTASNRVAKTYEAQLKNMSVPADTPDEPVNVDTVLEQLKTARDNGSKRVSLKYKLDAKASRFGAIKDELESIKARFEELKKEQVQVGAEGKELAKELEAIPVIDTAPLDCKIKQAQEINADVQKKRNRKSIEAALIGAQDESDGYTKKLSEIDDRKSKALAAAKFPVPGLGFGEDYVTYNDVPLQQCSSAERLKVSMSIAMAVNAKLPVVLIRDGSLLDDESMEEVKRLAEEHDAQVWIECVGNRESAIIIEDGAVKGLDQPEPMSGNEVA